MIPRRIQLSRAKGWRLAEHSTNVQIVDRRTVYGNLFNYGTTAAARSKAVEMFTDCIERDTLDPHTWGGLVVEHVRLKAALAAGWLAGKDVACWCPLDQPCHGDVLLTMANPRAVEWNPTGDRWEPARILRRKGENVSIQHLMQVLTVERRHLRSVSDD